jgi:hypothetical protein
MVRVVARCASAVLVAGLCAAAAACGGGDDGVAAPARPPRPTPERVLLGPPDPHAGTQRGVFVSDPRGQVERIAAGGRLVAWSVRTPAARLRDTDTGVESDSPLQLPDRSVVVVADERGGTPLKLDLGQRWVRRLRMLRGPQGNAAPQLAVEACADLEGRHCAAQLVALATRPLRIVNRSSGGRQAAAAVAGRVDEGRQVVAGSQRGHDGGPGGCAPRLSIERLDGTGRRALPAIRFRDALYTHCARFERAELHGRYAFAWIDGKATGPDTSGLEGTTVVALDVDAGPQARWRAVQWPYRYSDGSTGYEIGPAITDAAMYWEEIDDETTHSLELVALPRDVLHAPRTGKTPRSADPITPKATTACDLAATDDAIYELDNARCAPFADAGGPAGGGIHRIVAPVFRPDDG